MVIAQQSYNFNNSLIALKHTSKEKSIEETCSATTNSGKSNALFVEKQAIDPHAKASEYQSSKSRPRRVGGKKVERVANKRGCV